MVRKKWIQMGLPFLYEVISESMWCAMGWSCDGGSNAVIDTQKKNLQMEKHEMVAFFGSKNVKKDPEHSFKMEA